MYSTIGVGDTISRNKKNKNKDCNRTIFTDDLTTTKHKYGEVIRFSGKNGDKLAIAIGLNPAQCDVQQFDATNMYVARWLKKNAANYDGYILLNLFSVVQPSCPQLVKYIKSHLNDVRNNCQDLILKKLIESSCDVYIFWGPNAKNKNLVTNSFLVRYIEGTMNNRNYYYSYDNSTTNTPPKFEHASTCKTNLDFEKLSATNWNQVF